MKKAIFCFCLLYLLISCSEKPAIQWIVTTPDASWIQQETGSIEFPRNNAPDIIVDIAHPQQTIDGFGTCFNELGWTSLSLLSGIDKDAVFRELFAPGAGANFTICRMPVGANDFSLNWYSYDESDGDFAMDSFSIANDKETLIPFIKKALSYNPNLKIWASPWSPPTWMKYNKHYACNVSDSSTAEQYRNDLTPEQRGAEGTNMFIQHDTYFEAYALYFAKFIAAYRNENISISMVMPQNEFNSCQVFPSCTWTPEGLNEFVGKFLGPKMQELGVDVLFGTMERPDASLIDTLLKDENSSKYITGVGFQWAGKDAVKTIHEQYPNLKIYQTEQECGNGANDWTHACHAWDLMKLYLGNGANAYEYWNTSLLKGGMSRWGWSQNSLVVVDKEERTYAYTYEYYLMKHLSHFILPGAQRLNTTGAFANLLAFKNPDGSLVLVIQNDTDIEAKPLIQLDKYQFAPKLKPNSFNTLVISP
ncbi:glycosyl hydrolase [Bacteroidia bacterium]|nr:glycosyl hydrolase [Bacteroidia bacterium]